ncbi:hypothetical protein CYY_000412 [Polysphondylium violaceum]|uniref:Transmembrane protein n=1 Tax=Polysphondylium violaceum TaxID=133409 RepID=A0A8J4Q2Y1_9MYCE|nr:hypothetical protein CYY_000412 [Polysphondylium violaceum]
MNKLLFTFLATLLLVTLASALTQQEADAAFGAVVSASLGDDAARTYLKLKTLTGFLAIGVSINGTVAGAANSGSFQSDSTVFTFDSNTMNYLFAYSKTKLDFGSFSASASANAYFLNYRPTAIIEYKETNGEQGFQFGKDTILGWVRLDKLKYTVSDESQSFNNEKGAFKVNIYEVKNDIFSMMFYITEAPVSVAGNDLSAGQSKIDISINNYYDSNINKKSLLCDVTSKTICSSTGPSSDPESRLAVSALFINANANFDLNTQGDINVKTSDDNISVGFNWIGHADVKATATDKSVAATVSTNSNSTVNGNFFATANGFAEGSAQILIHSFDAVRPNSVVWDPSMGAGPSSNNSGLKVAIPTLMIIISVLVALLF